MLDNSNQKRKLKIKHKRAKNITTKPKFQSIYLKQNMLTLQAFDTKEISQQNVLRFLC